MSMVGLAGVSMWKNERDCWYSLLSDQCMMNRSVLSESRSVIRQFGEACTARVDITLAKVNKFSLHLGTSKLTGTNLSAYLNSIAKQGSLLNKCTVCPVKL